MVLLEAGKQGTARRFAALACALLTGAGCGLTDPFAKAVLPPDAGPTTLNAPLEVLLASASPTIETTVKLTVVHCGLIAKVLVNEGEAPTASTPGWVSCVTTPGAISATLQPGRGAHFLHVWGEDAAGNVTGSPAQVAVVVGDSALAMGDSHNCVLVAGAVKCWGDNSLGQLGDGSTVASASVPVQVIGLDSGVDAIASGIHGRSTCALRGGGVQCWGANPSHELGNDEGQTDCTSGTATLKCRNTPAPVVDSQGNELHDVISLHAGSSFYCATLSDDSVRCWGDNTLGQLGDGQVSGMSSSSPVAPGTSTAVSWIAAGTATTCGLVQDGTAITCWGFDYATYEGYGPSSSIFSGTSDSGTGSSRYSRTPLDSGAFVLSGMPQALTVGYYHACGLFSGTVKCWGLNARGQVGSGLRLNTPEAVDVQLPGSVDLLISGAHHNCARLTTGAVYCWGMNDYAQLGRSTTEVCGDRTCSRVPLVIDGLGHVAALGAGRLQTCAVTDAGLSCWGADTNGLLQGGGTETCTLSAETPASPCSHQPVLIQGI